MSAAQSEIIELSFAEPVTVTVQVRQLLPTIEHDRSEGRSLTKIYAALVAEEPLLNCQWRPFETVYYRIRESS